jgi:signal transduction histidine kinase
MVADISHLKRTAEYADKLLGIVGHDLRNPLQAASLALSHLRNHTVDENKRRNLAERGLASVRRAQRLVEQLLDYTLARIGGGIPVRTRPVDVSALTREAIVEVQSAHPDRAFRARVDDGVQAAVDPDRFAQVLANLLTNAVQHSPRQSAVDLAASRVGDRIEIAIRNDNVDAPIPEETLATLFEPFARGPRSQSLGLGLYIVREIVAAHGGDVAARSDEAGTSMLVRLPAA